MCVCTISFHRLTICRKTALIHLIYHSIIFFNMYINNEISLKHLKTLEEKGKTREL